jgi:biopolymer transport protein ExbD
MAVSMENGGRGRRKGVTADLLLVPYIDLLTCMVAFLLITAVWTQIARLDVTQKGQGELDTGDTPPDRIAVLVHEDAFSVVVNNQQHPLPQRAGEHDYLGLGAELTRFKLAHPDRADIEVVSEDTIKFDILVKTMDTAMSCGLTAISLVDATGAAL